MPEQQIVIPLSEVSDSFATHLNQPDNKRILFSAPFGAGKSFFLNEYFEHNENVLSIRLHPVDYSVASNEDIFELIKHDILNELIEKYGDSLKLDKQDFSNLLLAQEFIRNKMDLTGIGKAILTALLPHGGEIVKIGEELKKLNEDFNSFSAELSAEQEKEIKTYLAALRNKKGSIRENDAITLIIKDYVQRIKAANGNKPFVFLLDDLDRLDPEHLFRLFNVFTAHHDSKTDRNKFDFDQLIFVCDIRNVHQMFMHKYGRKVDFSGYIDKFYSSHIFHFDFKKYLKESVKKLLMSKYDFEREHPDGIQTHLVKRYDFKGNSEARQWGEILEHVIGNFISYDLIKIRSFERFQCYCLPNYEFEYLSARKKNAANYYFLVLAYTLQQFFPRYYELRKALGQLSIEYDADYDPIGAQRVYYDDEIISSSLIQIAIPFLMDPAIVFENRLEKQDNAYFEYQNEKGKLMEIHYSVDFNGTLRFHSVKIPAKPESSPEATEITPDVPKNQMKSLESITVKRPNPYWFLLQAFRTCQKQGYLRLSKT